MFEFMMKAAAAVVIVEVIPIRPPGAFKLVFMKELPTGEYSVKRIFNEAGTKESTYPMMSNYINDQLERFIECCDAIENEDVNG